MKAYIGTSGWMYKHWNERFFPPDLPKTKWLQYYQEHFNTVEINSTFYHFAPKNSFIKWNETAGAGFLYATKLSHRFTQYKKLILDNEDKEILFNILSNTAALSKHLGPLLIQLPPSFRQNTERLAGFLEFIRTSENKLETNFKLAVEFRHISWLNSNTFSTLKDYATAFCISDSPRWPTEFIRTAPFVYVRLHGTPRLYASNYSKPKLNKFAEKLNSLNPKELFVYFDNDKNANAAKNALYFKSLFV